MKDPDCPQKGPYGVELDPGRYFWCSCGLSESQPFCDGSHKGSAFEPVAVEISERSTLWLCGCKRTAKGAQCDGTHKNM